MGNLHVSIRCIGSHHNGLDTDVEQMAGRFVDQLRQAGHQVISAEVTSGGVQVLVDGLYGGDKPQERSLMPVFRNVPIEPPRT